MNHHLRTCLTARGGIATRRELRNDGVSDAVIRTAVAKGDAVVIAPRVYGLRAPRTPAERLGLALAAAGPAAVASHRTAAWLWSLLPEPRSGDPIWLTVPHGAYRPTLPRVTVAQARWTEPTLRAGWPVTSVRRMLVDLAGLSLREFRFVALDAAHRGLLSMTELTDPTGVPRCSSRHWSLVGEEALAGAASGGEAEYWRLLQGSGLPMPELNVPVLDHRFVVDALWRRFDLVVEIDGREHHTKQAAFAADARRQNALHAAGFVVLRFPVSRVLTDPAAVLAETETVLQQRAGHRGMAMPVVARSVDGTLGR